MVPVESENYGIEHAAPNKSEPAALFRQAILDLDLGAEPPTATGWTGHAEALVASVRNLVDAFAVARSGGPADDRAAWLREHPIMDPERDKILVDILQLEARGEWTEKRIQALTALERRYRASLPRLRQSLIAALPGYVGVRGLITKTLGSTIFRWIAAGLVTAIVVISGAYQMIRPQYQMDLKGQIFWTTESDAPFSEARSRFFTVTVDGEAHDYTIRFDPPIEPGRIRVDPVDSVDPTEIAILRVRLVTESGPVELEPGPDWSCRNCLWLGHEKGEARLQPLNEDPYLVGPAAAFGKVAGVEIRMRVTARKTLWEWITRLNKPG